MYLQINPYGTWYHGSDVKFDVLREGSTITQWMELAEAFSHKPTQLSFDDNGVIEHNGMENGFLYVIDEPITADVDIYRHPRTTMEQNAEFLTTRPLKVRFLRELPAPGFRIETERLVLREMTTADYDALYAVLTDSDIMQHYPYTFDETRVRGWINSNVERYRIFGFGLWAVTLKENGEMIGDCGLTMQKIGSAIKPEIGYHIRKDCQRKGYAKEAASAVRDWTFRNTPFQIIYSYMKYTNIPSASTAISWGCTQVDEITDEVNEITKVYAITRREWKALGNN